MARRDDRLHGEAEHRHLDLRKDFQHDRDRILYSAALRRMAGITQVLPAWEGHGFHNRLTHSLKVAQVGRRLGEYLLEKQPKEVSGAGGLDPDVIESAALAHDLGHPPFGHGVEETLDEILVKHGETDGFEGNAQSFRILTRTIVHSGRYAGLNLTRATLNAGLKYPWFRDTKHEKRNRKWGAYRSDGAAFAFARELSPGHEEQCLEAAIMDWADDVAYAVHDLDDFYRAGLIPLEQLVAPGPVQTQFLDHPKVQGALERDGWSTSEAEGFLAILNQEPLFFPNALKAPYAGSSEQQVAMQRFSSLLITRYLSTDAGAKGAEPAVSLREKPPVVKVGRTYRGEVNLLKTMASVFVFDTPALLAKQRGQRGLVLQVFEDFYQAAGDSGEVRLLPAPFHEGARRILGGRKKINLEDEPENRARLVADAIVSLGESQIAAYHRAMRGIDESPVSGPSIT